GADVRERAVVRADGLADIFVQNRVHPRIEKQPLRELAVICRKQTEAVLEHIRPVQVRAESWLDLEEAQTDVLALEADEPPLVAVEDLRLGRLLKRRHQLGRLSF